MNNIVTSNNPATQTTIQRVTHQLWFIMLAALLGMGTSFSASAVDLFVSPGGSDGANNCQTQVLPCLTVNHAITQAVNGDVIRVGTGVYDEEVTVNGKNNLTITSFDPTNKATLTRLSGGPNQPIMLINGAQNISVTNLKFDMDIVHSAEAILALGNIEGLLIEQCDFDAKRSVAGPGPGPVPGLQSSWTYKNVISINRASSQNSKGLPASSVGHSVTIINNQIEGQNIGTDNIPGSTDDVWFRAGISMDHTIGLIEDNTINAVGHDIHARYVSSGTLTIRNNNLNLKGIEVPAPSANAIINITGNTLTAPANADDASVWPNLADFSLVRMISNTNGATTTFTGNTLQGYANNFRGMLVENYNNLTISGNTFTPKANATDFTSLVIANKEVDSDNASAPMQMQATVQNNTFNDSGAAGAGTAVHLINDNDSDYNNDGQGDATFGSIQFGGDGANLPNSFAGNHGLYFKLDDHNCQTHDVTVTPTPALCSFINYKDTTGNDLAANSLVTPFRGDVKAQHNNFAGKAPAAMDTAEFGALIGKTQDYRSNNALGLVNYGVNSPVYVDDNFTNTNHGDTNTFVHTDTNANNETVIFGGNAFATIAEAMNVVSEGGTIYVAAGTYAETVNVTKKVDLIGNGSVSDVSQIQGLAFTASGTPEDTNTNTPADPIIVRGFVVTNTSGAGLTLAGDTSELSFEGVAFDGNDADGVYFSGVGHDNTTKNQNIRFVGLGNDKATCRFNGNGHSGIRTANSARVSNVSIDYCSFNENKNVGILMLNANSSGDGQITAWRIDHSDFLRNDKTDATPFGGGIWIKTAGSGSLIDDVLVQNSLFEDNGSSGLYPPNNPNARYLNRVGIHVRARPSTTLTNVRLCNNTFRNNTSTQGTQEVGVYVVDQATGTTNGSYMPVEMCGTNTFDNLVEGISGYEQFVIDGDYPQVNITGSLAVTGTVGNPAAPGQGWNYLAFAPQTEVYVDDAYAGLSLGSKRSFTHPQANGGAAFDVTYGVNAFATIAEGIAAVESSPANVGKIYVAAGSYVEGMAGNPGSNLIIQKPVHLIGEQATVDAKDRNAAAPGESIIYPAAANPDLSFNIRDYEANPQQNAYSTVVVMSSNVTIDGFTIDGENTNIQPSNGLAAIADVDVGVSVLGGSHVVVKNNIIQNAVSGGFGGAVLPATSPVGEGNQVVNNWIKNTDLQSTQGNGVGLIANFYAKVENNKIENTRVGVRTNYFTLVAPQPTDALISGNIINARAVGVWHNYQGGAASPFTISNNTITADTTSGTIDGVSAWNGIKLRALSDSTTATIADNSIDGIGSSATTTYGYHVSLITTSQAEILAISGGSVSNTNVGVLATDGDFYAGSVNNIDVGGVAFSNIGLAAIYAEDTKQENAEASDYVSKITVNAGNTFNNVVKHEGALSGAGAIIDFDAADLLNTMLVRASGNSHRGTVADSQSNVRTVAPGIINHAIADAAVNGTVTVEAGTFAQTVLVNKEGIKLVGDLNQDTPAYDATRQVESLIQPAGNVTPLMIQATNIQVNGLKIATNRDDAVVADDATEDLSGFTFINNIIEGAPNNALKLGQGVSGANVMHNSFINSNTTKDWDQAAIVMTADVSDSVVSCNKIEVSTGLNSIAILNAVGTVGNGAKIFHNASDGNFDIYSQVNATIGANWYGGTSPSSDGAGTLQLADALGADPLGKADCGKNTAANIILVSGSPQSTTVNTAFANDLRVRVTDALGGAVMGESVSFARSPAAQPSDPDASLASASVTTDFNGYASTTASANTVAGGYAVNASSGTNSVVFNLSNSVATVSSLICIQANVQTPCAYAGTAGSALNPLTVRALDQHGNPVAGATIVFTTANGTIAGNTVVTGANGEATSGVWTLGAQAGIQTATATVQGSNTNAQFTATAAEVADIQIVKTSNRSAVKPGDTLSYALHVSNAGPSNATSINISDALPSEFVTSSISVTCAASPGATCPVNSGTNPQVTLNGAAIPVGGSVHVVIEAQVDISTPMGDATNPVSINNTGYAVLASTNASDPTSDAGNSNQSSVSVEVTNAPSINAVDDTANTDAETQVTIDVLANDTTGNGNIDRASLKIDPNTQPPSNGTTACANGVCTFEPQPGFSGDHVFKYEVCLKEVTARCDTATVTVTVGATLNAVDDLTSTLKNDAVVIDVLTNDVAKGISAIDLASLAVQASPVPQNGSVTCATTGADAGKCTFTPSNNFIGDGSFEYTVCLASPNNAICDTAKVTITVAEKPAVDAVDDSGNTLKGKAVTVDVLDNDRAIAGVLDENSLKLDVNNLVDVTKGTVACSGRSCTFTPAAGFDTGTVTFGYEVCLIDPATTCGTATVTINVAALPVMNAKNDALSTLENTAETINVFTNDTSTGGTRDDSRLSITRQPAAATGSVTCDSDPASANVGECTLTPTNGFVGLDSFEYRVCLQAPYDYVCDSATVSIEVAKAPAITANMDSASTTQGSAITIDVIGNDQAVADQIDASSISIASPLVDQAAGTVACSNGTCTFTPSAAYTGNTSFEYQVCLQTANTVCGTARVELAVVLTPEIDAINDRVPTTENTNVTVSVFDNDTVVGGARNDGSLTIEGSPVNGAVTCDNVGSCTFVPTSDFIGTGSFTYRVCMAAPHDNVCDSATVTIDVLKAPALTVISDTASTTQDTPITIDVLANDVKVAGTFDATSPTVAEALSPANAGTVTCSGGQCVFTPDANFVDAQATFKYQACLVETDTNGAAICGTETVTIDVVKVPKIDAMDDTASTTENTNITLNVFGNDTVVGGMRNDGSLTIEGSSMNGTVTCDSTGNNPGSCTFVPTANFTGTGSFTYRTCMTAPHDSVCDSATVTIDVVKEPAITVTADEASTLMDTEVTIDVVGNDAAVGGALDVSGLTVETQPTNGTLTCDAAGQCAYKPNTGYIGNDSFRYKLCLSAPNETVCGSADVAINVLEEPVLTAKDDNAETNKGEAVLLSVLDNDTAVGGAVNVASVTVQGTPVHGQALCDATGKCTFTPEADFVGLASFTYRVCMEAPNANVCDAATAFITVKEPPATGETIFTDGFEAAATTP